MLQMPNRAEELLSQIGHGDERALEALYQLFSTRVYNTALSYLQHPADAEEVTQDVFVEVYHSAAGFAGRAAVATWIYRITVNKSLDRLRHQRRRKRFAVLEQLFDDRSGVPRHDAPHFDHPGVSLEQREDARLLFAALDTLPEPQKTAYILSYIEELPQREVAAIMQTTAKAVESLNHRARENLRRALEKYYPGRGKKR